MSYLSYSELTKQYGRILEKREMTSSQVRQSLKAAVEEYPGKIVVLDDDPTGVQAVHGIYVYTDYTVKSLAEGLLGKEKLFFVLTNSRALTEAQTIRLHRELAENLAEASRQTGVPFLLVSRGDSTLRGHFPLETEVLREKLEAEKYHYDGEILAPFFQSGGRVTIENIHYVKYGDSLIPAGETEFAKDKTFGYHSSNLSSYIEEKTKGRYPAERTAVIPLSLLRTGTSKEIEEVLMKVDGFGKVIVNALEKEDMQIFCLGLYGVLAKGKRFLFRTAADFVKAVGGISEREPLSGDEMRDRKNQNGGIIVVGSHTEKTTRQLESLCKLPGLIPIEFDSDLVLYDRLEEEIKRVLSKTQEHLIKGESVVIYTKRRLLTVETDTEEAALLRSVRISEAVQRLVGDLKVTPSFIISKGGITSSDIGVKALRVRKAFVPGQAEPGIPVWRTGPESKFPGIAYLIFPGNVGEDDTLKKIVEKLLFLK